MTSDAQAASFHVPIDSIPEADEIDLLYVRVDLLVHGRSGPCPLRFLFDTGTDVSIVGRSAADAAGLDLTLAIGDANVTGVHGAGAGHRAVPVRFAFQGLPTVVIRSTWIVMDPGPDEPLLALRDVHPHFLLATTADDRLIFTLRPDHGGEPA